MNEAETLAAVRRILDEGRPAEETIRAIRRVLAPANDQAPVERDQRNWPLLGGWQRHDDPEMP